MFCYNCGAKLPDEAKFCMNCGTKLDGVVEEKTVRPASQNTKFVPAKCTNCGGELTVDPNQQSATCPYCNTSFIVEQAITNYNIGSMKGNMNIGNATINVNGLNIDNLLARAKDFEMHNDFDNALIYYNKVLDVDISNLEAREGIKSTQEKKDNYVYIRGVHKNWFSGDDIIEVRKDRITVINSKGEKEDFTITQIKEETLSFGTVIQFKYPGKWTSVTIGCENGKEIFNFIQNAKLGKFPAYK